MQAQLTPTSYIVLGLVNLAGNPTPYELKRMVAGTVGHFWRIPHSQLYSEPERLTRAGFLTEEREHSGRRRRRYSLTERGRKALTEWIVTPTGELWELRDPGMLKLAFGADPARLAAVQLAAHKRRLELFQSIRARERDSPPGPRLAIEAGIAHEREYIRFWTKLARTRRLDKAAGKAARAGS